MWLRYCSIISLMLLRCCSASAAVVLTVATLSPLLLLSLLLLLLLGLLTVAASGGRIRVMVTISDCQACVSSLPIAEFGTLENSQDGKLIILYPSIKRS